ncbi:hypothetical protein C8R41DRAFT_813110 [Lentinula lateritia]|uniref:Uncharacterized protein n=1 Tax=Lentinula lateritia TaxID=40482 RepID=A0ABQ8VX22_9AGAR|nr:hypothetical protein C8R41DRAFT_813110 [Lentinula lateritia]
MNALAAQIQFDAESQGESPDFCVFSSWLGPLVQGAVQEGPVVGNFEMHIRQSVSWDRHCGYGTENFMWSES